MRLARVFAAAAFAALCLFAAIDYFMASQARRTFEFPSADGKPGLTTEERMLSRVGSLEENVLRYVEETLLGPVSLEAASLFPAGAALETLLVREDVAYIGLSKEAALPVFLSGDESAEPSLTTVQDGLRILTVAVKRNFPALKAVRIFIDGNEVFAQSP